MNSYILPSRCLGLLWGCLLLAVLSAKGQQSLTVYTYGSFVSEQGAGPPLAKIYQRLYGKGLRFVPESSGLLRVKVESGQYRDGVVIGLSSVDTFRWSEQETQRWLLPLVADARLQRWQWNPRIQPYDYAQLALMYNRQLLADPPADLEQLTQPRYAGQLIFLDPATSSLGVGFLLGVSQVYGEGFAPYLRRLQSTILTAPDSWDAGYALFLRGEAAMVLSLTTSEAYHRLQGEENYQVVRLREGGVDYIEGAAILAGTKDIQAAQQLLALLLTEEVQRLLCSQNVMLPVVELDIPQAYRNIPQLQAIPLPPPSRSVADFNRVQRSWLEAFIKEKKS